MKNKLMKICNVYNLGKLEEYTKEHSSQNNVYKVITDKGTYIIKEFTKDAISNYYYLTKRKKQIQIAEKLNKNNISCQIPKKIHKRYFFLFKEHYYLVYDYAKSKILSDEEYTYEHIKVLAETQSKIHKLNIKVDLPCHYKKVKIDFNKVLNLKNKELDELIKSNKEKLEDLINTCNENINAMKQNLCISHNDYKVLNILWDGLNPTLIDFDASGLANPTCCLSESAFTFARQHKQIDYDKYRVYLTSYINNYGSIKEDYKTALYVSMSGKIQWYSYLISKKNYEGIISMTKELLLFYENIEKFYEIYKSIV